MSAKHFLMVKGVFSLVFLDMVSFQRFMLHVRKMEFTYQKSVTIKRRVRGRYLTDYIPWFSFYFLFSYDVLLDLLSTIFTLNV